LIGREKKVHKTSIGRLIGEKHPAVIFPNQTKLEFLIWENSQSPPIRRVDFNWEIDWEKTTVGYFSHVEMERKFNWEGESPNLASRSCVNFFILGEVPPCGMR
jgi:hypothetical protein